MNLVGFSIAVKGLNNMSKSSGRGRYHSDGPSGPSAKNIFFAECKDIITECSKMPTMAGKMIPYEFKHKERNPYTGKKEKTQEEHKIFIAEINPDISEFENMPIDISKYSVIGMIDDDKIFGLNSKTGNLDIIEIEACFSYGPHGDFDHYYNISKEPLHRWEHMSIVIKRVISATEIDKDSKTIINIFF